MTTPTPNLLAEFADAFAALKARWPDAPGLPEGYVILNGSMRCPYRDGDDSPTYFVPHTPALALCLQVGTQILDRSKRAAWVEYHSDLGKYRVVVGGVVQDGEYDTDISACLAALRAMGGVHAD